MHSKLSQFHIHIKINSQEYSNPIPRAFEPMITHQVSIPWIINKWNHALVSRSKITNEPSSIPKYKHPLGI